MRVYVIIQATKGVETPVILNPGYLDIKVAEKKLEELTAPRIAYYEWKNAQHSYVYNSAKYVKCTEDTHISYKAYENALKEYDCMEYKENKPSEWDCIVLNNKWREALSDRDIAVKELEAEFKEANPVPQVNWDITYSMGEVDILHTHQNNNIAWTMLPSEVIYENGGVVNFEFTTKFSHAVDALVAIGMSAVQIEDFFQNLGVNVYREHVQLYLNHGVNEK